MFEVLCVAMKIEQIKDETIIDLKRTLTECCCNKKAFCLTEFVLSLNGYASQTLYKRGGGDFC